MRLRLLQLSLILLLPAARVSALEPAEVAVIFNTQSIQSLRVARYYLNARKIPQDHLIPITITASETVSEEQYRARVVPQIRKFLADHQLSALKCLVTTYDVPLKIGPRVLNPVERQELEHYRKLLDDALAEMGREAAAFDAILPTATGPATVPAGSQPSMSPAQRLANASVSAAKRIQAAPDATRSAAMAEWARVQQRSAGIHGLVTALKISPDAPATDPSRLHLERLAVQLAAGQKEIDSLAKSPENPATMTHLLGLHGELFGLNGQVQIIEQFIAHFTPADTEACLDSELAWILRDQNYPRAQWTPNPANIQYPRQAAAAILQPMLIARLDGSTVERVLAMIDTTLQVEAKGLDGKIYLDARGLHAADSYSQYDDDIRKAADWLKAHSTMEVVLDDREQLFEAKDCPDAALYCGWYSLHNYRDSCQWLPGAVGYHVASFEMTSLHTPAETGWVVNLLNRGFCGTLGATDEPYLTSFPKPQYFFPLLLGGEFTQGEVWLVTSPSWSWRVGFVGDPLYNPFKAHPRVKDADLRADPVLRNAYAILRNPVSSRPASAAPSATRP